MILAGDETGLPVDTPSAHLDTAGPECPFAFVGALAIQSGGTGYRGVAWCWLRIWTGITPQPAFQNLVR